MTSMILRLRPGEKLYLNGAVIKVDRRVSIEVLNDVDFLFEAHVLQADDADTPLKQLYFVVQSALIEPGNHDICIVLIEQMLERTIAAFSNRSVVSALFEVEKLLQKKRFFEALKMIRSLYEIEWSILHSGDAARDVPIRQMTRI